MLAQNRDEIAVRVALVQKDGLAEPLGELQLAMERLLLRGVRREIAEVVETAFADGDHLGGACGLGKLDEPCVGEIGGVMGMDAGRGEQPTRVGAGEVDGIAAARTAGAGDDHLRHTGVPRARNDGVPVAVVAVVGQVDPDVDQGGRR